MKNVNRRYWSYRPGIFWEIRRGEHRQHADSELLLIICEYHSQYIEYSTAQHSTLHYTTVHQSLVQCIGIHP